MSKLVRHMRKQDGFSTLVAIVVVVVASLVIAGLTPMVSQATRAGVNSKEHMEATYAAQAGVKRVQAEFENKNSNPGAWSWLGKRINMISDDKRVQYEVTKVGEKELADGRTEFTFCSTGYVSSAFGGFMIPVKEELNNVKIIVNKSQEGSDAFSKYTLYSAGAMNLTGQRVSVIGDVATLGTSIDNNQWNHVNVNGKYYALKENKDKMHLSGGVNPSDVNYAAELPTFKIAMEDNPAWPQKSYAPKPVIGSASQLPDTDKFSLSGSYKAASNTNLYQKTITLTGNTTLQVNGSLNLNNTTSISGDHDLTLVVNGKMELTNAANIKVKNLKVYATQGINFNSTSKVVADSILLQTEGKFELTNSSTLGSGEKSGMYETPVEIYADSGINLNSNARIDGKVVLRSDKGDIQLTNYTAVNACLFENSNRHSVVNTSVEIFGQNIEANSEAEINGMQVKIHATKNFSTSNNFSINDNLQEYMAHNPKTPKVKAVIYSDGTFTANNRWVVNAHDCLLQSGGNMSLNGQLELNGNPTKIKVDGTPYKVMENTITRVNSHRNIVTSGGKLSIAGGTAANKNAGIVTAEGGIRITNYIDAANALFIANDEVYVNGQAHVAGIYTNAVLNMIWGMDCCINENNVKPDLMKLLSGKGYLPVFSGADGGEASDEAEIVWPDKPGT